MKEKGKIFLEEHREGLKLSVYFLIFGMVYCLFTLLTGIGIPCIFHKLTGLCCPGCGISRYFLCLVRLDFVGALRQNLAVALLLPFWLFVAVVEFLFNPTWLSKDSTLPRCFTLGSVVLLVVFGILRNLPSFSFLLPK